MTIGPFPAESRDEDFVSPDAIDPNQVFAVGGNELRWDSWFRREDSAGSAEAGTNASIANFARSLMRGRGEEGALVFRERAAEGTLSVFYLVNYLYVAKSINSTIRLDTTVSCQCLLNGSEVFSFEESKIEDRFHCHLRRGWNSMLFKCVIESADADDHQFTAALTDSSGEEIDFLLVKNGFVLPHDTETHLFGKNPDDANQSIEVGDAATDYKRSNPDIVVYVPREAGEFNDGDNEHFLVVPAPKSEELLAFWTQSSAEGLGDNHIVMARSRDGGMSWSEPVFLAGTRFRGSELQASWAFPVCSKSGRLYCFYSKATSPSTFASGIMGSMQSDDNGYSWVDGPDIPVPTTRKVPEDENSPVNGSFIVWQSPIRDSKGRQIVGYTMWNDDGYGKSYFMRFNEIDEGPELEDLSITWLNEKPVVVPETVAWRESTEPSVVLLPDGRLFVTFRTLTGFIWYSVSEDDGVTWREPEILKYSDGGQAIKHPMSCAPIYALENGKYLLLHHNSSYFMDRYSRGVEMLAGMNMFTHRRPLYLSVGTYAPEAWQPIWFDEPRMKLDNDGVVVGSKGTNEIGTYTSLTEHDGRRILWYPDRKYYLLGKILTDEMLGISRS